MTKSVSILAFTTSLVAYTSLDVIVILSIGFASEHWRCVLLICQVSLLAVYVWSRVSPAPSPHVYYACAGNGVHNVVLCYAMYSHERCVCLSVCHTLAMRQN